MDQPDIHRTYERAFIQALGNNGLTAGHFFAALSDPCDAMDQPKSAYDRAAIAHWKQRDIAARSANAYDLYLTDLLMEERIEAAIAMVRAHLANASDP